MPKIDVDHWNTVMFAFICPEIEYHPQTVAF